MTTVIQAEDTKENTPPFNAESQMSNWEDNSNQIGESAL